MEDIQRDLIFVEKCVCQHACGESGGKDRRDEGLIKLDACSCARHQC
jgi:hypothetical protein